MPIEQLIEEFTDKHPGKWSETGWQPPVHLQFERYEMVFEDLRKKRAEYEKDVDVVLWWIGDLMVNGENALGERFSQMLGPKHMTKESLIKVRRTAEEFRHSERWSRSKSKVGFWLHWEVQKLGVKDRERLLKKYNDDDGYSRDDLRADVRALIKEHKAEKQEQLFDESGAEDLVPCPTCGEGHVPKEMRDDLLAMKQELEYLRTEMQAVAGGSLSDALSRSRSVEESSEGEWVDGPDDESTGS